MKTIYLIIALALSMGANSQIQSVSLQASGLTCSMCSNAINKALKTLEFVDKVDADISRYTFNITFRQGSVVDFERIRKKVEGAGFSVSGFAVTIQFNNVTISESQPVTIDGNTIFFVNMKEGALNGLRKVKLLDKGFVSPKEAKRNSFTITNPGTYHATI